MDRFGVILTALILTPIVFFFVVGAKQKTAKTYEDKRETEELKGDDKWGCMFAIFLIVLIIVMFLFLEL